MSPEAPVQGHDSSGPKTPHGADWPPIPLERLEAVRSRDPVALEAFFEHFFDRIFGLVYRLLGDRHRAEDVTQDVFLKAQRGITQLDTARDPGPWLYTIATNACRDLWRSGAWRMARRSTPTESTIGPGGLRDPNETPDVAALRAERERMVQRAIMSLPEALRIAVMLHDFEGLDHLEIAGITGVSHAAARKRYSRALELLALRLKEGLGS